MSLKFMKWLIEINCFFTVPYTLTFTFPCLWVLFLLFLFINDKIMTSLCMGMLQGKLSVLSRNTLLFIPRGWLIYVLGFFKNMSKYNPKEMTYNIVLIKNYGFSSVRYSILVWILKKFLEWCWIQDKPFPSHLRFFFESNFIQI